MHKVSIETKLKEGRGSGTGADYKPYAIFSICFGNSVL